jgi:hypothetical protein
VSGEILCPVKTQVTELQGENSLVVNGEKVVKKNRETSRLWQTVSKQVKCYNLAVMQTG